MKDKSKNFLSVFIKILLSSITTLIVYIVFGALLVGFSTSIPEDSLSAKIILIILTSIITIIFSYLLVFFLYTKSGYGEKIASKDFENGYCGFFKDVKNLIVREKAILITLISIATISCAFNLIDSFLLEKSVLSYISLPFAPIMIISLTFSQKLPFLIIGYFVAVIITCIIYILVLALHRKMWYTKWNISKK